MKKLILPLLAVCVIASLSFFSIKQNQAMSKLDYSDYEKAWKIVDSLEQQGLPESALKHVEAIHGKAKKEKNAPQLIKAIIYRGKFQSQLEEDGLVKAIGRIAKETEEANFPAKPVLQSIQAELYSRYMRNKKAKNYIWLLLQMSSLEKCR